MGLDLKPLLVRDKTQLEALTNKIVAIDAYNAIYQFLAIIRGPEGLHLTDSQGRVTSHITGLLFRNINFLTMGIKPVYVFDGKPPSLKSAEIEKRKQIKKEATVKYEKAISSGDMEEARKYAQQTTSMRDGMVEDSKKLLDLFGIPHIQAPSEGEATAASLTITGQAYASASQDFDSILFGAKRLVRNFTNSGRRKLPNRNSYIEVLPEIIEFSFSLEILLKFLPSLIITPSNKSSSKSVFDPAPNTKIFPLLSYIFKNKVKSLSELAKKKIFDLLPILNQFKRDIS